MEQTKRLNLQKLKGSKEEINSMEAKTHFEALGLNAEETITDALGQQTKTILQDVTKTSLGHNKGLIWKPWIANEAYAVVQAIREIKTKDPEQYRDSKKETKRGQKRASRRSM